MPKQPKTLSDFQQECRRLAAQVGDPVASRILSRAADDLERLAQDTDNIKRLN
jgi:hypothetical protein